MYCKKILTCFMLILLLLIGQNIRLSAQATNIMKWVVEKNSTLKVQGNSNVNSFSCDISQYAKKDTLTCIDDQGKPIKLSGEIQMDILSFNCHSNLITKDLRKTLKSNQYPVMTIRFISLENMPILHNKSESIKGWVEVDLAGIIKKFELSYSFLQAETGYIQLLGGRNFRFSDFNLSPPRKLAGLIKIKDDFNVNFQLVLRTIKPTGQVMIVSKSQ